MTTQPLCEKPSRALVMVTNDVLTIVVSSVDNKRLKHKLEFISIWHCNYARKIDSGQFLRKREPI